MPIDKGVRVVSSRGEEIFDRVIIATHSPTTTKLIANSNLKAKDVLEKIKYGQNKVVVHQDESVLPDDKRAWTAWNYLSHNESGRDVVSCNYLSNLLQPLPTDQSVIVTLNAITEIDRSKIIREID